MLAINAFLACFCKTKHKKEEKEGKVIQKKVFWACTQTLVNGLTYENQNQSDMQKFQKDTTQKQNHLTLT